VTNLTFTVSNSSLGTLSGSSSVAAPFVIVSGGEYSLSPGQTQVVTVAYAPIVPGTNSQTVTFSGGGGAAATVSGVATAPAPVVSPIAQTGAAVDTNASSLQVFSGSTAQYSGSASDPTGYPLSWQWSYIVNGGPEIVHSGGTGAVLSVSFNYTVAMVGNVYVWKLRVNNGYSSAESELTVGIEASPAAPGGTMQAAVGTTSAPFNLTNGYIYQPVETTVPANGGLAVFNFSVPNTGGYTIQAIVNAASDANNSFYINIDAEPQAPTMIWDIPITAGFEVRWVSWRGDGTDVSNQFVPKIFTLTQGQHQILIRGREVDTELQSMKVLQLPTPPLGLKVIAVP